MGTGEFDSGSRSMFSVGGLFWASFVAAPVWIFNGLTYSTIRPGLNGPTAARTLSYLSRNIQKNKALEGVAGIYAHRCTSALLERAARRLWMAYAGRHSALSGLCAR